MTEIRWLLGFAAPATVMLVVSTLARILGHLAGAAAIALPVGVVANAVLHGDGINTRTVATLTASIVGIVLAGALLRYLEQFTGHFAAFALLGELRVHVMAGLIPKAPAVTDGAGAARVLEVAVRDVDRIEVFFAHTIAPAVSAVVVPAIAVVVAANLGGAPAGLALAAVLLVGWLIPLLGRSRDRESERSASRLRSDLAQHVSDSLRMRAVLLGAGTGPQRLDAMEDLDRRLAVEGEQRSHRAGLRSGATTVRIWGGMLVVLAVGLATASDALVGVLVATALVPGTASGLDTLERLANSLPTGLAAARRVREMAESPAPLPEPAACSVPADGGDGTAPAEQTPAALLDAVDFYYPGADQPVLEDVSFTLERGGHVGLMGPTGSGKSTVARLLQRHQDPGAGRVVLHGADARVRGSVQVRRLVAVADQDPFLLEGTVAENLRLAVPEADESRMQDALDLACCELPLDRTVGRRGQSLSGGQRQRLALARTLLRLTDTPGGVANGVLVLDEATSHQEPQLQERIMENIGGIGSSTVTIAHRAGALRHTDLVVGLEEGRVCAVGPWTEVCRFPGVEPH